MADESNRKIAIIGAGAVGATIAYACLIRGVAGRIVLHDINGAKARAQALDLNHGLQFTPSASVEGSEDPQICSGADVLVLTAGARQKPGQTRMDLAAVNARLCREMIGPLTAIAPKAIILVVSNPVDVLTYIAQKVSGLESRRVMGSGCVLDSSRFRFLIAQRCRVAVGNVHAHIVGEHGQSEIPLWSSASIANVPLRDWAVAGHGKLTVRDRTEIFQNVLDAAAQIIAGKGATNYAIGLATARILEAILRDENRVLPVSGLLSDYRGISDVYLSVPRIVNRGGAEEPLPVPMNDAEIAGLKDSAEAVRRAIAAVGF